MIDSQGYLHFYFNDHLGSARRVVAESSFMQEGYTYWAFGASRLEAVGINQAYRYTGKPFDDDEGLDLYYYGARYYDPATGRFLAVDPLASKYPAIGPYVYTLNNPLKYIDPDGRYVESVYDIPALALSVSEFDKDPGWVNGAAVLLDGAAVALPAIPAIGGVLLRGGAQFIKSLGKLPVKKGMKLFRVAGGKAGDMGKSWTTVDPLSVVNPRNGLGLPDANTGEKIITATLKNVDAVLEIKPADKLGKNLGGLPEYIIDNAAENLNVIGIQVLEEAI